MNSSKKKGVYKIPAELLDEFNNTVPNATGSGRKLFWTEEHDAIILAMWPTKNRSAFIEVFAKKYGFGSKSSITERYRSLKRKLNHKGPDSKGLLFDE